MPRDSRRAEWLTAGSAPRRSITTCHNRSSTCALPSGAGSLGIGSLGAGAAAFLRGAVRFDHIHAVNLHALDAVAPEASSAGSADGLLALDAAARRAARAFVERLAR